MQKWTHEPLNECTLIMIFQWKWLYIFAISLCWLMGGSCRVRFVEGSSETVMISQLSCELHAFWSDLFWTSTKILFMLRRYLIAVVGEVIPACHHQTWEVALPFSDHCILGNFTPPPQLNGCVSHCEPCWGKHRQYVMSKKLTTVSHHTDSEDSCDILSCTEGKY